MWILTKLKILIILIIKIKLWPKENNLQSVTQHSSSQDKELPSPKTVSMLSLLLPIKKQAKLLLMQLPRHYQADLLLNSLDQSEEEAQHLPQLKSLPSKLLNPLKSPQRKPSLNKSLSLPKNKKWIWEDSLIDELRII